MKILLTNDDGYDAVNIKKFFKYLSKEHDVWMVAPKNNCSGMSSAISFLKETKIEKISGWNWNPFICQIEIMMILNSQNPVVFGKGSSIYIKCRFTILTIL